MYAILLALILQTCTAIVKENKSNELTQDKEKLHFSGSDKSYQYVDSSAMLHLTPVINQRILKDSYTNYDENGASKTIYLPQQSSQISTIEPPQYSHLHEISKIHTIVDANPLLAALLLSSILGIEPKSPGFNHPQHLPTNPYVALLLSQYGRYIPLYGAGRGGRGIYGYSAANNYHNNKPFGAYKIYEDRDV